jgi:hypothetical protein
MKYLSRQEQFNKNIEAHDDETARNKGEKELTASTTVLWNIIKCKEMHLNSKCRYTPLQQHNFR